MSVSTLPTLGLDRQASSQTSYLSIGQVSTIYGIFPQSLRREADNGKISVSRSIGGKRFFRKDAIENLLGIEDISNGHNQINGQRKIYSYNRVSSFKQSQNNSTIIDNMSDLGRQIDSTTKYGLNKYKCKPVIIKDIGSGLNDERPGFQSLLMIY